MTGSTELPSSFLRYPSGDRSHPGPPRTWDNCRHGYGLDFQRLTGITACAKERAFFGSHPWLKAT
jgi:hypothetical protein